MRIRKIDGLCLRVQDINPDTVEQLTPLGLHSLIYNIPQNAHLNLNTGRMKNLLSSIYANIASESKFASSDSSKLKLKLQVSD